MTDLTKGTRVALRHDIERYPHFIAPKGATGVITEADHELFAVKMDEVLVGAEDWDNEIHWYPLNEEDPTPDLIVDRHDVEVVWVGSAGHLKRYSVRDSKGKAVAGGLFRTETEALAFIGAVRERTILVHLNISIPTDSPASVAQVVEAIEGALEVGLEGADLGVIDVTQVTGEEI